MLQQSRPDSRLRHPHFGQAALLNGQSELIVLMGDSTRGVRRGIAVSVTRKFCGQLK